MHLSGDKEKDLKYLIKQSEKYRNHEYSLEIIRAIGRLVYKILPEEERDEFLNVVGNQKQYIDNILSEVKCKLVEHNLEEAEKLILKIHPDKDIFCSDRATKYYDFSNPLEEVYFRMRNEFSKEIKCFPISYNEVFQTYAYILVEKGDYKKALKTINAALKRNPLFVVLMFEKAEVFKKQKKLNEYFSVTGRCFELAYRRADIARCYRNFGYWFIEDKNWDAAICCYLLSILWVETEMAKSELYYITKQAGRSVNEKYYHEHSEAILQKYNIPLEPNPLWIEIALSLGEKMCSNNEFGAAVNYYTVAYELTGNNDIHDKIVKLQSTLK